MTDSQKSTFFWPMALLSNDKRSAMMTLYKYCRELDDIADTTDPLPKKEKALQKWEVCLKTHALPIPKFDQMIKKFGLPVKELKILIDGMRMDLEQKIIIPNLKALHTYCRHVAGSVGILAIHIFGLVNEKSKKLAILLGETLQITNILRDVQEDKSRNRLYIPTSILKKYVNINQPIDKLTQDPNFHFAWRDLANLVQTKFIEVEVLFKELNSRCLWPARAMMHLYHEVFLSLCESYKRDHIKAIKRPKLSNLKKFFITFRCMIHYPPMIKMIKL